LPPMAIDQYPGGGWGLFMKILLKIN